MNMQQPEKDLVVLVADKNMEFALKGLLDRYHSFQIRNITSDIHIHPQRDPGCLLRGHYFLRPSVNRYAYALVILDREGCGQERKTRELLEDQVEKNLFDTGWSSRAAAIVIDPELDTWVWSDSPHVDEILGWELGGDNLRSWLREEGLLAKTQIKPGRPKEAMEKALRIVHKPRSASVYLQLSRKVSFDRCTDQAFLKLKATLQKWFS